MLKVENKYNYFILIPNLIWIVKGIVFFYTNDVLNDHYLGSKFFAHFLLSFLTIPTSLLLMGIFNKAKWKSFDTDFGWLILLYIIYSIFVFS